jgi:aryl-alcohol dehydrogenase-like predicted oxidoreductase
MKTPSLGSLEVSAVGLGCMGMTYAYGPADETEALRACVDSAAPFA